MPAPCPAPTATAPVPPSPGPATYSRSALSPADEFKKGIKRDIAAFKPLKERKHWNTWHRTFRATALSQGLGDVLDETYSPSTADEQALFDVLQADTFAVFTATLHLSETSTLVRRYSIKGSSDEGNAQLIYIDLVWINAVTLASRGLPSTTSGYTKIVRLFFGLLLSRTWPTFCLRT